jgi:hypothetical protein
MSILRGMERFFKIRNYYYYEHYELHLLKYLASIKFIGYNKNIEKKVNKKIK